MTGWIGVDLDGTLAEYHGWLPGGGIGKPIPKMVQRVKEWISQGKDVRIFTARNQVIITAPDNEAREVLKQIQIWCLEQLGTYLPITNVKDMAMIELWDDRAVQVIPNTGERADEPTDLETYRLPYAIGLQVLISCYEEKREVGPNTLLLVKSLLENLKN